MTLLFTAINGAVVEVGTSIGLGSISMLVMFVLFLVYFYHNLLFNSWVVFHVFVHVIFNWK